MTYRESLKHELESSLEYFERSSRVLQEEHSTYAPVPGQYTVAVHVAHMAITIDWFLVGAFGPGFDMDFGKLDEMAWAVSSLTEARKMLGDAYDRAIEATQQWSEADWQADFPEGSIMKGPKGGAVFAIVDHSAHHRGALTVYSRLLGLKPLMPYMEMA